MFSTKNLLRLPILLLLFAFGHFARASNCDWKVDTRLSISKTDIAILKPKLDQHMLLIAGLEIQISSYHFDKLNKFITDPNDHRAEGLIHLCFKRVLKNKYYSNELVDAFYTTGA